MLHGAAVVDVDSGQVLTQIAVGGNPTGVATNTRRQRVYVTNAGSASVSVINMKTHKVIDTIAVGRAPMGIAVTPDGSRVYVANLADNTVSWFAAPNSMLTTTASLVSRNAHP
jgi:YVTN family beta-propeller protein